MGKNSKIAILVIIVIAVAVWYHYNKKDTTIYGSLDPNSLPDKITLSGATAKIADLMAKGYTEAEAKQLAASTNY